MCKGARRGRYKRRNNSPLSAASRAAYAMQKVDGVARKVVQNDVGNVTKIKATARQIRGNEQRKSALFKPIDNFLALLKRRRRK